MAGNLFFKKEKGENTDKTEKIYMIDPYSIDPNPNQPRKFFTDEAILRLADSIKLHGLIQPLTVRESEKGYELIAGERRLRAVKLLGFEKVPCVISNVDSTESAHLAIIENIQRENLNMFEQANAILNLIRIHCLTQEKIATELSCSQSYIANKIRLLKLSDEEREIIIENNLSERHARALLRVKDENKRFSALKNIVKRALNVASAEDYIDTLLCEEKIEKSGKTKMVCKDVRLFYNTIEKAIDTMRSSGINVITKRNESLSDTEFVIVIPKMI